MTRPLPDPADVLAVSDLKARYFEYLDANGKVTQELATVRMNTFITDRAGDIWACTEQGLLHFDCSGDRPHLRWTPLSTSPRRRS